MKHNPEKLIDFDDRFTKVQFLTKCGALTGKWVFSARKWKPKRSNRANALYWVAYVPAMQEYARQQGDFLDAESAHEILKRECLGTRKLIDRKTGVLIGEASLSSAKLDTAQFAEYLMRCEAWLAQMGVVVPTPEQMGLADDRAKARKSA